MDIITAWTTMKSLAILELSAAIGIAGFWIFWLNFAKAEPWMPSGFMDHEKLFVLPDLTMAIILGLSSYLLLNGYEMGLQISLLGAGMMLFLIIIDIVFLAQNKLFSPERNGIMHFSIIFLLSLLCCLIVFASFFLQSL